MGKSVNSERTEPGDSSADLAGSPSLNGRKVRLEEQRVKVVVA